MKKALIIILLMLTSSTVQAVDGYKSFTFGMTLNQLKYLNTCSFAEDNPKTWYNWFRDFSRLIVYTCSDYKFGDRKIKVSLTFIDRKLHKISLVHSGSIKYNEMLMELLKSKYGFRTGSSSVNLATTLFKFMDQTVEAEIIHPPAKTLLVHYFSDQFGWFMSQDPQDRKLIDEL